MLWAMEQIMVRGVFYAILESTFPLWCRIFAKRNKEAKPCKELSTRAIWVVL